MPLASRDYQAGVEQLLGEQVLEQQVPARIRPRVRPEVRRLALKVRRREVPLGERCAAEQGRPRAEPPPAERAEARARLEAGIFNRC